jgi:hypothetical protein
LEATALEMAAQHPNARGTHGRERSHLCA